MLILPTLLEIKRAFGSTVQYSIHCPVITMVGYKHTSFKAFPGSEIITETEWQEVYNLFCTEYSYYH